MTTPIRLTAVIAVVGVLVGGCGGGSSKPPTTPSGGGPAPGHIPVGATRLTTTAYVPNPLNVQVGAAVTWINDDTESHTSTSQAGGWDSGNMPPGSRFTFTFRSAGSFNYLCLVHANMVGTVNVQ